MAEEISQAEQARLVWQIGRVEACHGQRVKIVFDSIDQCQRCLDGQGCGAGIFTQLFSTRGAATHLNADFNPAVGQWVRVGISPSAIVRASALLYAWPLALFMGVLILGHYGLGFQSQWVLLGGALLAAGTGVMIVGRLRSWVLDPIVIPWSCTQAQLQNSSRMTE